MIEKRAENEAEANVISFSVHRAPGLTTGDD